MSRLNLLIYILFFLIFPIKASEPANSSKVFFTIYFVNGTFRSFYSGDIEEIRYSDIDNNGVKHPSFVVQEIKLTDKTERYLISDIQEISFENVNLLFDPIQFDLKWQSVNNSVEKFLDGVKSFSELEFYMEELKSLKDVSEVFHDDTKLIVTLQDGSSQFWNAFPKQEIFNSRRLQSSRAITIDSSDAVEGHIPSATRNVLLFNQTFADSDYSDINKSIASVAKSLQEFGFNVDIKTNEWRTFYNLGQHDINILYTHGCYAKGKHWLLTGIEASYTEQCNLPEYGKYWVKTNVSESKEQYCMVSEDYIADYCKNLNDKIVFTTACQALENDYGLAHAFLNNGAKVFIGYDGTNSVGHEAANYFLNSLCEDKTVLEALRELPYELKEDLKTGARIHAVKKDNTALDELNVCFWPHGVIVSTVPQYYSSENERSYQLGVQISGVSKLNGVDYEIGVALVGYADEPEIYWLKCENCKDGINFVTTPTLTAGRTYEYIAYMKFNGETYVDDESRRELIGSLSIYIPLYIIVPGMPPTMYDFLARLYATANGDHWDWNDLEKRRGKKDWLGEECVSEWYGITEVGPNLYDIDLNNENIDGKVDFDNCPFIRNINFSKNKIQYISFKNCPNLENVVCHDNRLSKIDIRNCPKLKSVDCNNNNLSQLALNNCPQFIDLYVNDNNLESINIATSQPIRSLYCSRNKIPFLDFFGNPYIEYIDCDGNPIKKINLSHCKNFQNIYFNKYGYEDIIPEEIDVSHSGINEIYCVTDSKKLIANNCPNLESFDSYSQKNSIQILNISNCNQLVKVRINGENLKKLDMSGCSSLEDLKCWGQLDFLDVTGCQSLEVLFCEDNNLTQIIHGSLPNLRKLVCNNNKITRLDWKSFPNLYYLDCRNNPITSEIPYDEGIYIYDKRYEYVQVSYQYVTIDNGVGIWEKGEPYYPIWNNK